MSLVFRNARMVLPGELVQGSLSVADGRIAALHNGHTGVASVDLRVTTCCPAWSRCTPTISSAT
jgi:alpha-D-ribose 1-methylphosphonate 5-triphosphate diphosphatase PhnM